jgi:hypothetical protein
MPKRFAFVCAILLFLSTSAHAQPQNPLPSPPPTLWDHNGSVMYLGANGSTREFHYQKPRPGMLEAGAGPDSLLFRGQFNDGQFSGTAYVFNAQCGQVPFEVKGPVLDNGGKVVLTGKAPLVGRNCQPYGYYTSTLEFKLLKTTEVAQPQQPPATAQAPSLNEPKPDVPSSDLGEPARPSSTAQTPSVDEPKLEVPSSEVNESKRASNPPAEPSMLTQTLLTAHDAGDQKRLAPVIIALNAVLPLLSILFLVTMLRSSG